MNSIYSVCFFPHFTIPYFSFFCGKAIHHFLQIDEYSEDKSVDEDFDDELLENGYNENNKPPSASTKASKKVNKHESTPKKQFFKLSYLGRQCYRSRELRPARRAVIRSFFSLYVNKAGFLEIKVQKKGKSDESLTGTLFSFIDKLKDEVQMMVSSHKSTKEFSHVSTNGIIKSDSFKLPDLLSKSSIFNNIVNATVETYRNNQDGQLERQVNEKNLVFTPERSGWYHKTPLEHGTDTLVSQNTPQYQTNGSNLPAPDKLIQSPFFLYISCLPYAFINSIVITTNANFLDQPEIGFDNIIKLFITWLEHQGMRPSYQIKHQSSFYCLSNEGFRLYIFFFTFVYVCSPIQRTKQGSPRSS